MPIKKVSQLAGRRDNGSDRINRSTNLPAFDSFTMCGWFKRLSDRGATEQRVLGYIDSGSGWSRLGWDDTGDFNFDTWSGADASMTDPGDNWFFAAMLRLGSGVNQHYGFVGYIDGHIENQSVQLDSTSASANFEWLSSFDVEWVDGLVAGAALWRVPLSLAEIEKVFHSGPLSIKKGLMSYYPFDGHDKDVFNNYDIDTVTSIDFEPGPIIKVIKPRFATVDLPSDTRHISISKVRNQPIQRATRFDRSNPYGKYMHSAYVPAWDSFEGTGSTAEGLLRPIGNSTSPELSLSRYGVTTPTMFKTVVVGPSGSLVRVATSNALEITDGHRFLGPSNQHLETRTESMSVLAIFRMFTTPVDADGRIFTIDEGSNEADHDFMIGYVRGDANNLDARARIRNGTSTTTLVVADGTGVDFDAWNCMVGTCDSGGNISLSLMDESGNENETATGGTQFVNWRTTTQTCIASTAGSAENPFDGDLLCIYIFDGLILDNFADIRALFKNPWQVFEQKEFIPINEKLPEVAVIEQEWTKQP